MKKRYILAILICSFGLTGIRAGDFPDENQTAADNLIISGTIIEKSIRQPGNKGETKPIPVQDAGVFLENNIYSAATDENGNFNLLLQQTALPVKNESVLTAVKEGYAINEIKVPAGNNSTMTNSSGAFSLALITARSNPRMQLVFTSEKYKPVSRWFNLNYFQPVVINLEKKSRLITIAGKVELPEEERSSLPDYNEFTVTVDYGNKQYRTQTRDLGAFAISFARQAVDAAVCSLKIGNPGYDDIRETINLPARNDTDVFIEKQYFPKLKKITRTLSATVQGYKDLPLNDVVYNIYSPVNIGFCSLGGKLDKHLSREISLPVFSPDLKVQLSAPYYEQKTEQTREAIFPLLCRYRK